MRCASSDTSPGTSAARLAEAMEARGVGVRALAEAMGASPSTVRRMLSGDRVGYLASWCAAADALGVDVGWFVSG